MKVDLKSSEILIYPNPSKSIVNFKLNEEIKDQNIEKIEIINSAGILVISLMPKLDSEKFSWDGKTSHYKRAPSGVYFIRFKTGSKYSAQKFVLLK